MEKWLVAAKKADFNEWSRLYQIDPVLARIIRNRDVVEVADVHKFLYGTMEDCYSPWLLYGMEEGTAFIAEALQKKQYIRVIGDYDVDGICASYILTKGLQVLGAKVDTAIPHRMKDGYGLNEHLITEAYEAGVQCIITCDNGIAAKEQVAQAKALGMRVVITDHHEVPFEEMDGKHNEILPDADAIIDPKQEACKYPFPGICGGVVAYKFIQALCEKVQFVEGDKLLRELLPFAALATVCDVMELKDENRIIVKEGIRLMDSTSNLGLKALIEVNELEPAKISAYHLGFIIGPCLNATGRLDTALRALELLQSKTKAEAMTAAIQLKDLNDSRKNLTLQGLEEAEVQIQAERLFEDKVMVVYLPQVHESLAGIIAGRIREKYHHPVFVLTDGEEGVKGSGRSIEAYHMYESMVAVKEHFSKFGGHKLAAGLTLADTDVEAFRRALNEKANLTEDDFVPRVHIDVPMPIEYASFELAKQLAKLEPYGVSNPKPLFAQKDVLFVGARRLGAKGSFAKFLIEIPKDGYDEQVEMMYFGDLGDFCRFADEKYGAGSAEGLFEGKGNFRLRISVTYQVGINSYKGRETLQFIMQNYC